MKYEAVIFDLDGTLVHTAPEYRYKVVGRTLGELGARHADASDIDRFWFEGNRDALIKEHFSLNPELFWEAYCRNDLIELRMPFMKVYDDVDFITELRRKGYMTGIVTGAPIQVAVVEICMLGEGKFDEVVLARHESKLLPKPSPQGLERCLDLLGVSCKKAIYVGNSDEDMAMARGANVLDVFLDRSEHAFPDLKPSVTIHKLYELRTLLGI